MRLHLALAALLSIGTANAATEIDLFFPVPVQGKLANELQRLVEVFNKDHADIHVTPVYSGSYDDTNQKTHAAIQAGKLSLPIDQVFPFAQLADAFAKMRRNEHFGKIVVTLG